MQLTAAQIALINKHLRKDNWLTDSELIAELTDHYIDSISDQMVGGKSFQEALKTVHANFGGRRGLVMLEARHNLNVSRYTLFILVVYMIEFNVILWSGPYIGFIICSALAGLSYYMYIKILGDRLSKLMLISGLANTFKRGKRLC